jgi:hypothetical protein
LKETNFVSAVSAPGAALSLAEALGLAGSGWLQEDSQPGKTKRLADRVSKLASRIVTDMDQISYS